MQRLLKNSLVEWRYKRNRKPLILRGARQVGKSWLLKDFGENFKNFHYLNFERNDDFHKAFIDLNPSEVIRKIEIISKRKINIENDLLIFDEIQECPRALTSLKYFCEELPELAVCSAG
ncbi:MAG: AAA family ATPase [Lentisphaeraceae bacterium]|nr:AAA family ATPase [Lentisphaeraceae bacterium]